MKIAAIWARVSTEGQRELSLEGQVERVKAKLEGLGYAVPPERILAVDWTSMNLYACPSFQELRRWIRAGEIQAIGVLDRDRLAAQGLQRLNFLADCKEAGVELIPYQGPPMLEGPEGQLVELALAIGKERSVERAQQGARDGLRDRAVLKGLPPTPVNPYGYAWDAPRTRLVPTKDWPNAEFICQEALAGTTLYQIQKAFYAQGIPSPTGHPVWPVSTLWGLVRNPLYAGRFYALRKQAVEPQKRLANTYGKSSTRWVPLEKATALEGIVVENPPLTWGEYLSIQERLKANQLRASRNGKRTYRLRAFIICDSHHRRYRGVPYKTGFYYACPLAYRLGEHRCSRPNLPGPEIEEAVFGWAQTLLLTPGLLERELAQGEGLTRESENNLRQHLRELERRQRKNLEAETALVGIYSRAECSKEAFERQAKLLEAERTWLAEETARTQAHLEALARRDKARVSLETVRQRLGEVAAENPRLLLEALGVEVHVRENGELVVEGSIPVDTPIVFASPDRG